MHLSQTRLRKQHLQIHGVREALQNSRPQREAQAGAPQRTLGQGSRARFPRMCSIVPGNTHTLPWPWVGQRQVVVVRFLASVGVTVWVRCL